MLRFVVTTAGLLGTLLLPACVNTVCGCSPVPPTATLSVEGPTRGLAGVAGTELPAMITVAVREQDGGGVPGLDITFTPDASDASATPARSTTDATGRARTTWRLGSNVGLQKLRIDVSSSGGYYVPTPSVTVEATASAPSR